MYLKNKDIFSDAPPKSKKFTAVAHDHRGPRTATGSEPSPRREGFTIGELKRLSGRQHFGNYPLAGHVADIANEPNRTFGPQF